MRFWPKSKKVKELELTVEHLEQQVAELTERLETVEDSNTLWRGRAYRIADDLVAAKELAATRHKNIRELKGIINQMKEQQRGNSD